MSIFFTVHDFVLWLLELIYLDKSQFLLTQDFVDQLFNYYIYHSKEKLEETVMIFSKAQLKTIELLAEGEIFLPSEFDVACSGGGFKGLYALGAVSILLELKKYRKFNLNRWIGSSAGAQVGNLAMYALKHSSIHPLWVWFRFLLPYRILQQKFGMVNKWLITGAANSVKRFKPETREVFTCISKLLTSKFGEPYLEKEIIFEYENEETLAKAMCFTAAIPVLSLRPGMRFKDGIPFDGECIDGLPLFRDHRRPQLVINLSKIDSEAPQKIPSFSVPQDWTFAVLHGQDVFLDLLRNKSASGYTWIEPYEEIPRNIQKRKNLFHKKLLKFLRKIQLFLKRGAFCAFILLFSLFLHRRKQITNLPPKI